jgi:hypothetical protein
MFIGSVAFWCTAYWTWFVYLGWSDRRNRVSRLPDPVGVGASGVNTSPVYHPLVIVLFILFVYLCNVLLNTKLVVA